MRPLLPVILAVPAMLPAQWELYAARATSRTAGGGLTQASAVFDATVQALPWNAGLITPFYPTAHADSTTSLALQGTTPTAGQLGNGQTSGAPARNELDLYFQDLTATAAAPSYAVLTFEYRNELTSQGPLSPPSVATSCELTQTYIASPLAIWTHPGGSLAGAQRPQFLAASYTIVSDQPNTRFLFEAAASIGDAAAGTGTSTSDLTVTLFPTTGPQPNVSGASYGDGSAGTNGLVPTLRLRPVPTAELVVEIGDSLGGSLAVALISDIGPGPTPVTPQLALDVGAPFTILDSRQVAANGTATWSASLPPTLATPFSAWLQCAVLDPAATDGFALSNGLFVTID